MRHCPHCSEPTLRLLSVIRSNSRRPIRCKSCGEHAYLPSWARLPGFIFVELAVWLGVVAALWYEAPWPFVGLLLFSALAFLIAVRFWPLSVVRREPGTISFRTPSKFSSGE